MIDTGKRLPWRRGLLVLVAMLWGGLAGCASFPANERIAQADNRPAAGGYSYLNVLDQDGGPATNSEELLVMLAFSGGGVRASALAYGVLKALDETRVTVAGASRSLLQEVDVISSNSGGSYTAGAVTAFGPAMLEQSDSNPHDFYRLFLTNHFEGRVKSEILPNLPRLASTTFNRTDLAAEVLDDLYFHGVTYGDLIQRGRPFLIINATDTTQLALFEFTQETFDFLCSDLSSFKLARAVMASSALHGLFGAVRLRNYPAGPCNPPPDWLGLARQGPASNGTPRPGYDPQEHARATVLARYREKACFDDPGCTDPLDGDDWYVHLADGGAADNRGLRALYRMSTSTYGPNSLQNRINIDKVKRLVLISVDAASDPDNETDRSASGPGPIALVQSAVDTGIGARSSDSELLFRNRERELARRDGDAAFLNQLRADWAAVRASGRLRPSDPAVQALQTKLCGPPRPGADPAACAPDPAFGLEDFSAIWLSFDAIADRDLRHKLKNIGTRLTLPKPEIDLVIETGAKLLRQNATFQALVAELGGAPRA